MAKANFYLRTRTKLCLDRKAKNNISNKLKILRDKSGLTTSAFFRKLHISANTYYKLINMSGKYYTKEVIDQLISNLGITYRSLGIRNIRLEKQYHNKFSQKLIKLMAENNISCIKLAKVLGFSELRIYRIMESGICMDSELDRLAKFFNKKPKFFNVSTTDYRKINMYAYDNCFDKKVTGRKLEWLRTSNDFDIEYIAKKTNVAKYKIRNIEMGKAFCGKDIYHKLLKLYNITSKVFNSINVNDDEIYSNFIYFITNNDYIKIGTSKHNARIHKITTSAPFHTKLMAKISGNNRLECKIHKCLKQYRSNSEWFHYEPVVKRFCNIFLDKIAHSDEDPMDLVEHAWLGAIQDLELDGLNTGDY